MRAGLTVLALALAVASASGETLKVESLPSVLGNPLVKACRFFTVRGEDPANPTAATVEISAVMFDVPVVVRALIACRDALGKYPSEPSVIVAHFLASQAAKLMLFGVNRPEESETAVFTRALDFDRAANITPTDMFFPLAHVYLATAYEHGIGTDRDIGEAAKQYRLAGTASDAASAVLAKAKAADMMQAGGLVVPK